VFLWALVAGVSFDFKYKNTGRDDSFKPRLEEEAVFQNVELLTTWVRRGHGGATAVDRTAISPGGAKVN